MTAAVDDIRAAILAALLHDAPDWYDRGSCRRLEADDVWEMFFPTRGEDITAAKAVCAGCEVRPECLEYALANVERHGCWGGTSERERRDERHRRLCTEAGCAHHAHVEAVDPAPAWVAEQFKPLWPRRRAKRRATFGAGTVESKRIARALAAATSEVA